MPFAIARYATKAVSFRVGCSISPSSVMFRTRAHKVCTLISRVISSTKGGCVRSFAHNISSHKEIESSVRTLDGGGDLLCFSGS